MQRFRIHRWQHARVTDRTVVSMMVLAEVDEVGIPWELQVQPTSNREKYSQACCPTLLHSLLFLYTQVLERALLQASSQFNPDATNPSVGFVRLSGALHCDERSAFQEIAHQLCRCVSAEKMETAWQPALDARQLHINAHYSSATTK